MFRSLHMKLVLVLILLELSVMSVVGIFLINSVSDYEMNGFLTQMSSVFTPELISSLERAAEKNDISDLRNMLNAYSAPLGIGENRMFFILDPETGEYLAGSDDERGASLPLTPNVIKAMTGEVGQTAETLSESFDVAIPLRSGDKITYIIGVNDTRAELSALIWNILTMLVRALFFGLLVAILLSFLLSKTITVPIERLTKQATDIASGDFSERAEVLNSDEIGTLTRTFNDMAETLGSTLREVGEERNKLETLFKHMADGVVAFDARGKLINVNPAAQEMLGRTISEGDQYTDIFPDLEIPTDGMREDGHFMELLHRTGEKVLKMYIAPITVGEPLQGIMIVLHDITEQEKLDESRREFVANVSHELRTPLTNIKGYTETLIDAGADIDEETEKSFLGVIYDESDRMTRIVKDLLTLSRLDNGRMEMQMADMSLKDAAESAVKAMKIDAEGHGLSFTSAIPENMPEVVGDKGRIQQVIINLISNAVKYNRPDGSIEVTGGAEDGYAFISVRDTGLGIPKADLPHIFDRFYRVDKARSRKMGGTGLGLAIAKEIVEAHGGKITFDSVYGKGSCVTVFLPVPEKER